MWQRKLARLHLLMRPHLLLPLLLHPHLLR
jgi:hypothetical protein